MKKIVERREKRCQEELIHSFRNTSGSSLREDLTTLVLSSFLSDDLGSTIATELPRRKKCKFLDFFYFEKRKEKKRKKVIGKVVLLYGLYKL